MGELEEYFSTAAGELRDDHLCAYPSAPPEHRFSSSFENSLRGMIRQEQLGRRGVRCAAFLRQAGGILLAALLGIFSCAVCVGGGSGRLFEMLAEKYPGYTDLPFALGGSEAQPGVALTYQITDLPEGFFRVRHGYSRDGVLNYAQFEDEKEHFISFEQNIRKDGAGSREIGGETPEDIRLGAKAARLLEKGGVCTILWDNDQYSYMLTSNLSREQTIRLAQGVRLKARPYPTMQQLPIEALPERYPEWLALESGDVVFSQGEPQNLQQLTDFITACNEKKTGVVRLVQYQGESAVVCDLETSEGRIYYTRDEHRRPASHQPWELGEQYESISLLEGGGKKVLLLHTRRYKNPVEVVKF